MPKFFFKCTAVIIMSAVTLLSYPSASQQLTDKRFMYLKWRTLAHTLPKHEQIILLKQLKNYPLYLYAKYNYLVNHISTVNTKTITHFIHHYSNSPLSDDLKRLYIWTLYQQKKWAELVTLPQDGSIQSQCYYYHALYNKNFNKEVLKPLKKIWLTSQSLPTDCDAVLKIWRTTGGLTTNLILLRLELALRADNIDLAMYLAKQLPKNYSTIRIALLEMLNNPRNIVEFSHKISVSLFSKKMVIINFSRLAKKNPNYALQVLPIIAKNQQLTLPEQNKLKAAIAWQLFMSNATRKQIQWRDNTIASIGNIPLIERRIRQALRDKKDRDLSYWLNILPKKARNKDEWRYWRAIALEKLGQKKEAKVMLNALSKRRGFYAMLSAQKLGQCYGYNFNYTIANNQKNQYDEQSLIQHYSNHSSIKRIKELLHWGNQTAARREWLFLISQSENTPHLAKLARFAHLEGWSAYSIQATIAGKLWDHWIERFPPAYIDIFTYALHGKDIPLSYSLAISRQESALQPMVISPAGARGLMQLMPTTAKEIAKRINGINYSSPDQLYQPEINILLGTHFLESVYQNFNKNRILCSVAYNAGTTRLKNWLEETNGQLDAPAFIETIPFTETRNYVKTVLVYDYIYQLILNRKPNGLLVENEMNQLY